MKAKTPPQWPWAAKAASRAGRRGRPRWRRRSASKSRARRPRPVGASSAAHLTAIVDHPFRSVLFEGQPILALAAELVCPYKGKMTLNIQQIDERLRKIGEEVGRLQKE